MASNESNSTISMGQKNNVNHGKAVVASDYITITNS